MCFFFGVVVGRSKNRDVVLTCSSFKKCDGWL